MTEIGQCTISRSGPSQSLASTPSRNQPTALTQHALLRFRGGQLTLNQRVPGSSPGAPTNKINSLDGNGSRSLLLGKRQVSIRFVNPLAA
jgi:hypothetical protein